MRHSGAGGKLIHKKTRIKISRDTVPLRRVWAKTTQYLQAYLIHTLDICSKTPCFLANQLFLNSGRKKYKKFNIIKPLRGLANQFKKVKTSWHFLAESKNRTLFWHWMTLTNWSMIAIPLFFFSFQLRTTYIPATLKSFVLAAQYINIQKASCNLITFNRITVLLRS